MHKTLLGIVYFLILGLHISCEPTLPPEVIQAEKRAQIDLKESDISQVPDFYAYEDLPKGLPSHIYAFESALKEMGSQCPLLVHFYHPKNPELQALAYCMYTIVKEVGIYQTKACVGDLIDHVYLQPRPFYEENQRHWGYDGFCSPRKIKEKISTKETSTTENPITYLRLKTDEGFKTQIIQDKYKVASEFIQSIQQKL